VNGCNSRSSYRIGWFYWAWFAGLLLFFGTVLITSPGRGARLTNTSHTGSDAPGRAATAPYQQGE